MRVLVTGSNGQLGMELRELAAGNNLSDMIFTDVGELDITDPVQVNSFFRKLKPAVIINCAAYTAVDRAEQEPDLAMLVNGTAVGNLAVAAAGIHAVIVHISTDYVFDGHGTRPYTETDAVHPTSSYGKSKATGESILLQQNALGGVILRSSWLYSSYGRNFVKTILNKALDWGRVKVVSDQKGSPTYAHDLARAILQILPAVADFNRIELYHYANGGSATWFDLARAVVEAADIPCEVEPILTSEYPTLAPRPSYSVLDTTRFTERFGLSIPPWKESLKECVKVLY